MPDPISLRTRPTAVGDRLPDHLAVQRRAAKPHRGPGLHVVLFIATFATAAISNAMMQGVDVFSDPAGMAAGMPYALALVAILLAHEMGHYVLARVHDVDATLPYFIPAPPGIFFIGTLGAFIRMRSLPRDRRALFDVGAGGPWAGIVAALPTLVLGLALSEVLPGDPAHEAGLFLGDSLLFQGLTWLVLGVSSSEATIILHPIALAGWVGLLVTALNLLPIGQLDGGHVVYAAFGARWHRWISLGTLVFLIVLGLGGAATWLVWAALLTLLGLRHPRIVDVDTPLDGRRRLGAVATLLLFVLTFMPEPLSFKSPLPPIERDPDAIPVHAPAVPRRGGSWT